MKWLWFSIEGKQSDKLDGLKNPSSIAENKDFRLRAEKDCAEQNEQSIGAGSGFLTGVGVGRSRSGWISAAPWIQRRREEERWGGGGGMVSGGWSAEGRAYTRWGSNECSF